MKLLAYAPIKLTLLLVLGILIAAAFPIPLLFCIILLLCSIGVLAYLFLWKDQKGLTFEITASITVIFLGMTSFLQNQSILYDHHFSKIDTADVPQFHLKIKEVLKPNPFSQNYIATVSRIDTMEVDGKILVNQSLSSMPSTFKVDQELWVQSKVMEIKPPLNPHQFNFKSYMAHFGIHHSIKLVDGNYISLPNPSRTIMGYAQELRTDIIQKLEKEDFGTEQLSIIQALLLGERSNISEETYSNYIDAGAVHILAVSGLHVGILLLLIQFLLKPLHRIPYGKKISLFLTILLLWTFAFIAGLSPSIIRACTMFTFVAYAMYLNRPTNSFNILALSMFFILLAINPNLLFQVGFQMSYAAVFAIVWIYPLLQKWWFPKNKIIRYLWQLLSVSIAAQLGVLPISLFYFHQFPGLFFISNLLIVPFLGLILGLGIGIVLLTMMGIAPNQLTSFYNEVIGYMNTIVAWIAQQEAFIFKSIAFDGIQLLLGYLVIGSLIYGLTKISYERVMFFLGILSMFQVYTIYLETEAYGKKESIVLHQIRNSVLFNRKGNKLEVHASDSTNAKRLVENYKVHERIGNTEYLPMKNSYKIQGKTIQVIDSTGVYLPMETKVMFLLTQSPKINLERLIMETNPQKILADGSNYTSSIETWKSTCEKYKIPFHITGEMGFYNLNLE